MMTLPTGFAKKPTGGKTTRMVGRDPVTTRLVTRRRAAVKSKAKAKAAKGRTKLAAAPRPGQVKRAPGPQPPRERVKLLKGQVSVKARATAFAKQGRVRSIVGRHRIGQKPRELKQFAGAAQFEILQEKTVNSSWVRSIFLVMYNGAPALGVRFRSGVSVVYTQTALNDYKRMAAAASKGKFIWRALYHGIPGAGSPYIII